MGDHATHPEIGEKMLQGIDFLTPALPIVRHHHERWDGKGYPDSSQARRSPWAHASSQCATRLTP